MIPGQGTKIPHASQPKNQSISNKKWKQYCDKFNKDKQTPNKQRNNNGKNPKPKEQENYGLVVPGSYLPFSLLDTCNASAEAMMFKTAAFLALGLWPQMVLVVIHMHAWVLSCFSYVQWTVAHHAPLVHGILQERILEWVAISFSRGSS